MNPKIYQHQQNFSLESGEILPAIDIAYNTFGQLNEAKDNVIWVVHALTGSSDVSDWWGGLFGKGKIFDPSKYFIVCANNLGSCYGSTNALSINPLTNEPYYHDFPLLTTRDMALALELLRLHLQIKQIYLCIGGSQGGQIIQEWALQKTDIFENLCLIATNAFHSAWGIAFNEAQRMAIETDQTWKNKDQNAGLAGMKAARSIALISYRHYLTYQKTQSETDLNKFDDFKASSYQQYQGEKLLKRFNAFSYWTLSKAMDSHNVGRNRENIALALRSIKAFTLVIGIANDILFPVSEQKFLAKNIPHAIYKELQSDYGHDGFLIENEQISGLITDFLCYE